MADRTDKLARKLLADLYQQYEVAAPADPIGAVHGSAFTHAIQALSRAAVATADARGDCSGAEIATMGLAGGMGWLLSQVDHPVAIEGMRQYFLELAEVARVTYKRQEREAAGTLN
jgi:hypothetical protein